MSPGWSNQYFFQQLQSQQHLVHWYGIDIHDIANSMPSTWEKNKSPFFNPRVVARERHVRLPWTALKHHLDLIYKVDRSNEKYKILAYASGEFYTTENGEKLDSRPS